MCDGAEGAGPWFLAADVCKALGYSKAVSGVLDMHVDDDDRRPFNLNTLPNREPIRGNPRVSLVNESGLYALVLGSKLPAARSYKKWVTSEVLPSIRKNGGYMAPAVAKLAVESPAEFMARALVMANETIAGLQKAAKGLEEETPPEDEKALMNEWLDQVGLGKLSQSDRIKLGQRSRTMGSRSPRSARC
ncbi:hypothetical protein FGJ01_12830 [Hydrogenophaga intermedia]|uniref:BRO-N domain-containing protein n=1 Tax=Hydrogenophaga intermedia TaxID=65786 RepID=UPI00110DF155|nr:BRO family protein [Hydrogenophaga intermedia]TMU74427.1 hypothetical protein FGJ01_12830 [Hydrogenophaga intermedia]